MIAEQHIEQLVSLARSIRQDFENLRKENSAIDRELSDKYHEIEFAQSFNVVQGYKHAKGLQEILVKRRVIKGETCAIQPLLNVATAIEESAKQIRKAIDKHNIVAKGGKVG